MNTKLRLARIQKHLSQLDVCTAIGCDLKTYEYWELGKHTPQAFYRGKLCAFFGMPADELGYDPVALLARSLPALPATPGVAETLSEKTFVLSQPENSALSSLFDGTTRLTVTVFGLVTGWRGRAACCAELQRLLSLEFAMFDQDASQADASQRDPFSRRQALVAIAALPFGLLAASRHAETGVVAEAFLPHCTASLTACWHLMQGKDFLVVEQAISQCLPALSALAQHPSSHQQAAAGLAAQSQLLLGLSALHRLPAPQNMQGRVLHCQQAVEFARTSEDRSFLIVALNHLGSTYYELYRIPEMLAAYEEAAQLSTHETILPVLRGKTFANLARGYARAGKVQPALRSNGKAQATRTDTLTTVPVYLPDSGPFWSSVLQARMFEELGGIGGKSSYYEQAWTTLENPDITPSLLVPQRLHLEGVNQKASIALHLGKLEQFCALSIQGIQGARALQSTKRQQEVLTNWKAARKRWPGEPRILELADLLLE
ncbi:MAG: hypothetical protein ACRDHW_04110 [Ktedonobacteraceae bacterium]